MPGGLRGRPFSFWNYGRNTMKSRWNDDDAKGYVNAALSAGQSEALGLRIYTSRIIGGDPDLVLHGGGNTSVKVAVEDGTPLMHIKGSGWDLDTIEAPGLPAVRLPELLAARDGARLSDPEMVALLRASLVDPKAPNPSVEALLHAFIPFAFVDHSHATAILALADQPDMRDVIKRVYGERLAYVPYVMPGFDLSIEADIIYRQNPGCEGLWLENHGLFTFANDAKASYDLMIEFVTMAEEELARAGVKLSGPQANDRAADLDLSARIERALVKDGSPFAKGVSLDYRSTPAIRHHASKDKVEEISLRGTVTPDHVIRIKPWPLIIRADADDAEIDTALSAYAERYRNYFDRNAPRASEPKTMLDAYPRVVLVRGEGMYSLGTNEKAARIGGDLCEQATRAINAAEEYGRYTPIGEADLFDMEYWSLEQAKLAVQKPA
jgi:rhamnose utilization protein RhaD (predicted bifunctional aldolase and dehydrogenase)